MRQLVAIGFAVAIAACGSSQKKADQPDQPPIEMEPIEKPGAFPEIKFFEGDKHVLTLRKDGVVILEEKQAHVATLKPDLTLEVTNGKSGSLAEDGKVTFDGKEMPFTITKEAVATTADGKTTLSIGDDGKLAGAPAGASLRVEGATTPQAKRAALFLLVLVTNPVPAAPPPPARACSDGAPVTCKTTEPTCPEGQIAAVAGGCYGACVNATTCEVPPAPKKKKKGK